jgi:hypothetical protein
MWRRPKWQLLRQASKSGNPHTNRFPALCFLVRWKEFAEIEDFSKVSSELANQGSLLSTQAPLSRTRVEAARWQK